ncbi:hypothetical protein BBO99_00009739 [Phytophthora kernoviae]|uniref:ABC-2 type transporter domain-containing protein n=1 Tax=Phytophthora kernoviae TaxID=325452 RepID=A0A3R7G2B5_9STRA|nr:hypothetical protein BBI17_009789 [Phytophthora kernoviae]RLN72611.1 hypothetical protein BBO99_00009739 [Phytophthora kernoviae]
MVAYFESIDGVSKLEESSNPATWMLGVIGAGVGNDAGDRTDFAALFKGSEKYRQLEANMRREGVTQPSPSVPSLEFDRKRAATNLTQAVFLIKRFIHLYWRTPSYNLTRIVVSVTVGVSFGITFIGGDYSSYQGINSGLGMSYMTTSYITYITFNAVLPITYRERAPFYRERSSETYNAFWYFVGSTLVEIPYCFGATLIFLAIYFPLVGFTGSSEFFAYWLHLTMLVLVLAYFGQLLAYTLPSIDVAAVATVVVGSICTLFTGFNPPAGSIPKGYKWLHQLVPHKHTFAGITAIIFEGITVKEYVESVFEVQHSDIWSNLVFVVAWIVALRLLALLALQFINHQKR